MLVGGLVFPSPPPIASAPADSLAVHTVRFYRAGQEQTRVRAFVQLPYALLIRGGADGTGDLTYHVDVAIADTSGVELFKQEWYGHAPGVLRNSGGYVLETLNFLIPPGQFDLRVSVVDSVTGRAYSTQTELIGYDGSPTVSDVLLSPEMREISVGDTVPRAGELLIGNTMVTATAEVLLTPLRTRIHYLFEAYASTRREGTMSLAVEDATGRTLIRTPDAGIQVPANGAVFKGELDLAGLPEGSYSIILAIDLGDSVVNRARRFRMAGMHETLARDSIRRAAARVTDEGYFASMNEERLDSAKAPLIYLATDEDNLGMYDRLSVQAKRNYLARFWKSRDPTPGSPRNESREHFYGAIDYANTKFGEGRRGVPGWRTDRGRIYSTHGAPSDLRDRTRAGDAPPYQVWQYHRGKFRYYIFIDRTGFGAYSLMHSNDRQEATRADWMEILTVDATLDVGDYLGIDFVGGAN
jgi:GWxTD domain-containing protein